MVNMAKYFERSSGKKQELSNNRKMVMILRNNEKGFKIILKTYGTSFFCKD